MTARNENEIKLPIADTAALKRRLASLGFRRVSSRQFEINWIFDDYRGSLRRAGRLLRLRCRGRGHRARWMLTAKGPPRPGRHKSRPELELPLANGAVLGPLLALAGLTRCFGYERYRTIFADGRGKAELDEMLLGVFLELEGPPAWIDRTARALGYQPRDYITRSYCELLRRQKIRPARSPAQRS